MKPQKNNQVNGMQTEELRFLRAQVKKLQEVIDGKAGVAAPVVETKVENKTDLGMGKALRDTLLKLLVANENYFGPEKGVDKPKPSHELSMAMMDAIRLVKKERVPTTTFRKNENGSAN